MKLEDVLNGLTDDQRDFIAALDYGQDVTRHRRALDSVIAAGGVVDFATLGHWYPYEVIELGKNVLSLGHETEYAACMRIFCLSPIPGPTVLAINGTILRIDFDHRKSPVRPIFAS